MPVIAVVALPTVSLHFSFPFSYCCWKAGLRVPEREGGRINDNLLNRADSISKAPGQFVNHPLVAINLGDVGDEVEDTAGVAPLVVVPGDQLDEVLVQGDTGLGIEDGRVGVAVQVGGDNVILSVGQNAYSREFC